jgi:hypothetical protein
MLSRLMTACAVALTVSFLLACQGGPRPVAVDDPTVQAEPEAEEQEPDATEAPETEPADKEPPEAATEGPTPGDPEEPVAEPAEASEPAPEPAEDYAGSPVEVKRAVQAATERGAPMVLVDGPFAGKNRWNMEEWANEAGVKIAPDGEAVCLAPEAGPRGKWVASVQQPLDLAEYDEIQATVRCDAETFVAVGVWTGPADHPHLFESKAIPVRPGAWREISIPLGGTGFKSAGSDWEFGTKLLEPARTRRLSLFIYSGELPTVCWRNLRVLKGD